VEADVLAAVALATGLREGSRGVEEVLRHLAAPGHASTRDLSRRTGLPVPLVTAVCAELRSAGLLTRDRPARLSAGGRAVAERLIGAPAEPGAYAGLAGRLDALMAGVPPADPTLDQAHCTVVSKLRRVAYLDRAGALAGRAVLLLGDDDQMAVAIALTAAALGTRPPARLAVVDLDPAVLAFAHATAGLLGLTIEPFLHDLRRPLPEALLGAFDTVFTDPPYTPAGAELFVSRAAVALRPGPGGQTFLCFGSRPPDESAAVQHAITGMGFVIHDLVRNFSEYLGAGILAGTSHLYHLVSGTRLTASVTGSFASALYTGELRPPRRTYRCRGCGASVAVGAGGRWRTVRDLRLAGCPRCAGTVFRPGRAVR
jgi:predicted methyltransferase